MVKVAASKMIVPAHNTPAHFLLTKAMVAIERL